MVLLELRNFIHHVEILVAYSGIRHQICRRLHANKAAAAVQPNQYWHKHKNGGVLAQCYVTIVSWHHCAVRDDTLVDVKAGCHFSRNNKQTC